jgi:hemerythrin
VDGVAWTEDLSVGNEPLDQHHKRLFALLEDLERVVEDGGGLEAVTRVFAELNAYIAYHFAEEEAMMERAGFPFLDLHRHSHQTIALRVGDLAAGLDAANCNRIAGELRQFLSGWLVHHIEIEDFEYRPYINRA